MRRDFFANLWMYPRGLRPPIPGGSLGRLYDLAAASCDLRADAGAAGVLDPALQLALGTHRPPGPALIAPGFVVQLCRLSVNEALVSGPERPGRRGHYLSKVGVFEG